MSKNEMAWPSVNEVNRYRREVFELVSNLIGTHPGLADGHSSVLADHPLWALFMAMEHERIHFETSSVIIREMPLDLMQRPAAWPAFPATQHEHLGLDAMMPVPAAEITIGKPQAWPSYGWDNEYGSRQAKVEAFSVSQYMITNGQYLEFVKMAASKANSSGLKTAGSGARSAIPSGQVSGSLLVPPGRTSTSCGPFSMWWSCAGLACLHELPRSQGLPGVEIRARRVQLPPAR